MYTDTANPATAASGNATAAAARHLVKDRLDITGACCGLAGPEAVLKLRALRGNRDFEAYRAWHEQQQFIGTTRPDPATPSASPGAQNGTLIRSSPVKGSAT
jgi:hypothetical protein